MSRAQPQPLRIGQSAGFSSGQAQYSKVVKNAIEAAFAAANKQDGVNGRAVQLITEDGFEGKLRF